MKHGKKSVCESVATLAFPAAVMRQPIHLCRSHFCIPNNAGSPIRRMRFFVDRKTGALTVHCVAIDPTAYAAPNPNCCKNGSVFSAARCPSAMASSAR